MSTYRVVLPGHGFHTTDYVEADYFDEDGRTLRFYTTSDPGKTTKVAAYYEWLSVTLLPEEDDAEV